MKNPWIYASLTVLALVGQPEFAQSSTLTPHETGLIGEWEGHRANDGNGLFTAWHVKLEANGEFCITFYEDSDKTRIANTEHGVWTTANGTSSWMTDDVPTPDVYLYTFLDSSDRIHHVNTDAGHSIHDRVITL